MIPTIENILKALFAGDMDVATASRYIATHIELAERRGAATPASPHAPAPQAVALLGELESCYRNGGALTDGVSISTDLYRRIRQALTPSPAPSASPHQGADALREALAELVALKDLKDSIERWVRDETTGKQWPNMPYNERTAASADYVRRKPIAWDAARAALAQHQAPQQGEQQ